MRVSSRRHLLTILFLALAFIPALSLATLVNRSIDNQFGDSVTGLVPTYTPASEWANGATCCLIGRTVNSALPFDKTWTEATFNANNSSPISFSLLFNGTAVYVFGLLANQVTGSTTLTNLSFTLDEDVVGTFVHEPDDTTNIYYNQLMYANSSLPNAEHTLVVNMEGTVAASVLLFDYAMYTFDTDPITTTDGSTAAPTQTSTGTSSPASTSTTPSPPKHNSVGAIVGGVVGGLAALAAIVVLAFFCVRRRRNERHEADAIEAEKSVARRIEPFEVDADAPHLALGGGPTTGVTSTNNSGSTNYLPSGWTATHFSPAPPAQADNSGTIASDGSNIVAGTVARDIAAAGRQDRQPSRRRPAPGSKAAMRQQELDAQVRNIEREVSLLQSQRSQIRPARRPSGGRPPPSSSSGRTAVSSDAAAAGAGGSDSDGTLQAQIEVLRQQVQMLQAEQRRDMWEPPPGYENEEDEYEEDDALVTDEGGLSPIRGTPTETTTLS